MHYHIILTKECNLRCSYCGGGSDTPPKEIQYTISDLSRFMSYDDSPVIGFYGGEPLLRIKLLEDIMDTIPARYVLQTNGILLHKLKPKYLKKFHSILVSIDGRKHDTDRYRGTGVYDKIMTNLRLIRQRGFEGDLIARMTIPYGSDVYENVLHLIKKEFDHVHWQLGFDMFWEGGVVTKEWIKFYNKGISNLIKAWVLEMRHGKVLGMVPFIGVMNSLLNDKPSQLRCGSGIDCFTIMPDGKVSACPVSIDYDFSIVGSIFTDIPSSLRRVSVGEPCLSCDILHICGGRCLFVNHAQEMLRKDGYALICTTVRHLVNELVSVLPTIKELIERGVIATSDFDYPEFNNGCEIIP